MVGQTAKVGDQNWRSKRQSATQPEIKTGNQFCHGAPRWALKVPQTLVLVNNPKPTQKQDGPKRDQNDAIGGQNRRSKPAIGNTAGDQNWRAILPQTARSRTLSQFDFAQHFPFLGGEIVGQTADHDPQFGGSGLDWVKLDFSVKVEVFFCDQKENLCFAKSVNL